MSKRLFVSLSFFYFHTQSSNGFLNQIKSLLNAIQIAKLLDRELVVDGFFPDFQENKIIPLSKILILESLSINIQDGFLSKPISSKFIRDFRCPDPYKWLRRLQKYENNISDLFVGCCFYYCFDTERYHQDLQSIQFHPFFYQLLQSFFTSFPRYYAIHYRVESDFIHHFYKEMGFSSACEYKSHIIHLLNEAKKSWGENKIIYLTSERFVPPKNGFLFELNSDALQSLDSHIGQILPNKREILALLDFLIGESEQCVAFIGIYESSFSRGLVDRRNGGSDVLLSSKKSYKI